MSYPVVYTRESFNSNISRLILYYNRLAIQYLQRQSNLHENIHQARLCFKRIRSFLRLGRKGLGELSYSKYNTFYRDQSRALSQLRDLSALLETLPYFIKTRRKQSSRILLSKLRYKLQIQRKQQLNNIIAGNIKVEVITALQDLSDEIPKWNFQAEARDVFITGVRRTFSRGRKLFQTTILNPDDHHFHEWRKQVKYSWYHLLVLTPLWPGIMNAWAGEVQKLSQMLGKHHDLVLLENYLKTAMVEPKFRKQITNFLKSLQLKKLHIEQESFALGSKIYSENPAEFGKRLNTYWQ